MILIIYMKIDMFGNVIDYQIHKAIKIKSDGEFSV